MPRWLRLTLLAIAAVVVIALAALGGVLLYVDHKVHAATVAEAAKVDAGLAQHGAAFRADQQRLSALSTFVLPKPARDAAELFDEGLGWEGPSGSTAGKLAFPEALTRQLKLYGPDWAVHDEDLDTTGLDFGWMATLGKYAHWDVTLHDQREQYRLFDMPMPRFDSLQLWAKARLLAGLRQGALDPAIAEIVQLARLAESTETLLGLMNGLALRANVLKAVERARGRGVAVTAPEFTSADVDAARRAGWMFPAFASPLAGEKTPTDVWSSPETRFGRCAALQEAAGAALMVRGLAKSSFEPGYARLTAALAATEGECRLPKLRAAWTQERAADVAWLRESVCSDHADSPACAPGVQFARWPLVGPMVGEVLVATATADWFRRYEAPAPAP